MKPRNGLALVLLGVLLCSGCGAVYQAQTAIRTSRMRSDLRIGESSLEIHKEWGEPDIRSYPSQDVEIWSYAERANTNDLTATIFYTAAKEGDKGRFLDLKFRNHKLVAWFDADHVMPKKKRGGINYGLGKTMSPTVTHY